MKKIFIIFLGMSILLGSCAKPEYKTRKGKKKLRHYNSVPYN